MDSRPIGIFDSGLGGLTALRALNSLMPDESFIYFADSGRNPYGTKTPAQLRQMAQQDLDFLAEFDCKAILAACGTVSSTVPDLLDSYRIPSFGVLRASVETMSSIPGTAPLGIIATEASIKSGSYKNALTPLCPGREIIALPTQDFVRLVETGHTAPDDPALRAAVEAYLRPMKEAGICALLLGCTHFPIISGAISEYLGSEVRLVSASDCAALRLRDYLISNDACGASHSVRYFTSADTASFERGALALLGRVSARAEHIAPKEVADA